MLYSTALSVAEHAVTRLRDNEGNMSEAELFVVVYALSHALKAIADHNSVELPTRPLGLRAGRRLRRPVHEALTSEPPPPPTKHEKDSHDENHNTQTNPDHVFPSRR